MFNKKATIKDNTFTNQKSYSFFSLFHPTKKYQQAK
jgi:hypothetical protein